MLSISTNDLAALIVSCMMFGIGSVMTVFAIVTKKDVFDIVFCLFVTVPLSVVIIFHVLSNVLATY